MKFIGMLYIYLDCLIVGILYEYLQKDETVGLQDNFTY